MAGSGVQQRLCVALFAAKLALVSVLQCVKQRVSEVNRRFLAVCDPPAPGLMASNPPLCSVYAAASQVGARLDGHGQAPAMPFGVLEHTFDSPQPATVHAVATLAWFFALRPQEICADGDSAKAGPLKYEDVELFCRVRAGWMMCDDDGSADGLATVVLINVKASKTDKARVGTRRCLHQSGKRACPVAAAVALRREVRRAAGYRPDTASSAHTVRILTSPIAGCVTTLALADWLTRVTKTQRLSRSLTPYSLRRGGITALAASGATEATIRQHGRWSARSTVYTQYVEQTVEGSSNIAVAMGAVSATWTGQV